MGEVGAGESSVKVPVVGAEVEPVAADAAPVSDVPSPVGAGEVVTGAAEVVEPAAGSPPPQAVATKANAKPIAPALSHEGLLNILMSLPIGRFMQIYSYQLRGNLYSRYQLLHEQPLSFAFTR